MRIDKRIILLNIPYLLFFWISDKICYMSLVNMCRLFMATHKNIVKQQFEIFVWCIVECLGCLEWLKIKRFNG